MEYSQTRGPEILQDVTRQTNKRNIMDFDAKSLLNKQYRSVP